MDLYEDEVKFWEEFVKATMTKMYSSSQSKNELPDIIELADLLVRERRKRDVLKNTESA